MPLRDVDLARGTFDHHCHGCKTVYKRLTIARDLIVDTTYGAGPAQAALRFECPVCNGPSQRGQGEQGGHSESFNTNLGPEDADPATPGNSAWRAEQARLIRALMRHPTINLQTREGATKTEVEEDAAKGR